MLQTETTAEAARQLTVCNACRYCEGLCAVFPAMERRREFAAGDIAYLANLCHGCGACYYDCQFASPHEFAVDIPQALAKARAESYAEYAWPRALAPLFERNALTVGVAAAGGVFAFVAGFAAFADPAALFAAGAGSGAFYRVMPHGAMALLFGAAFLYALVAMAMGLRAFVAAIGPATGARAPASDLSVASRDAATLRYLDGGGAGCHNDGERPDDRRRLFHHLTFYGFLLCFASTCVATLYHYALGRVAPYALHDLPVVLGTLGGIGLVAGPWGLLRAKARRAAGLGDADAGGMGRAFLAMLLATSLSGLVLLVLRETAAMGLLLALHLGIVFALFVTMPYGKFVHGLYRFAALARHARERRGGH